MNKLSEPNEDYLERICELFERKSYARVSDIAEELVVKPASVTKMLQKLEQDGFVKREPYRGLTLTQKGIEVGKKIQERHKILYEFLSLINVPMEVIKKDIDGLEHHLSDETLKKLVLFIKEVKKKKFNIY